MSLARAALLARPRAAPIVLRQQRQASTDHAHHDEHHHDEHHDSTQYPSEGFTGPVWTATALASLLAVGLYKWAPEPNADVYLTRWMYLYTAPRDYWLNRNARHTAQQQEVCETSILITDAKKPRVHRYRYPQSFEQTSPFLRPVDENGPLTGLIVKGDKDFE